MQSNEMIPLHSKADLQKNDLRVRRVLILFGILTLLGVGLIVGALIWRDNTHMNNAREMPSQIITIAITLVWGALLIFIWGMKMTPLLGYRKFLKDLNRGLTRDVEGIVVRIDEDTTYRDGLSFYGVLVNVGDLKEPEDERLLYWDAQLGPPALSLEDSVRLVAHGNDIISAQTISR